MEQESLFSANWVEHYVKETRRGIMSIKVMDPIYDWESWNAQTQELKEKSMGNLQLKTCDEVHFYEGDGSSYGAGLVGLIGLRNDLDYWFEFVQWCDPAEVEGYDWDAVEKRLTYIWSLIEGTNTQLPTVDTVHDTREPEGVIRDIVDSYLDTSVEGPWKVSVSWGKDSTSVVQLILEALDRIPREKWTRPIHLITSDTCLELPPMLRIMRKNLKDFEQYVQKNDLPFKVHLVQPSLNERFFTNLIGKGYTPPLGGPIKRWCTSRLKINPQSRMDKELLAEKGHVVAVLGTRYDESISRKRSMEKWEGISRYGYTTTPQILSYTPVANLSTEQVWNVLREGFWWGNNYQMLEQFYKDSSFDDTTAFQNRSGCALCFVVSRDKSLINLVEKGYTWLKPLLDYRQTVLDVVADRFYREPIPIDRRTAQPTARKARNPNLVTMGGINQRGREYLLGQLLETQAKIQEGMAQAGYEIEGGYELISPAEIHHIKSWWHHLSGYTEPGLTPAPVVPQSNTLQAVLF